MGNQVRQNINEIYSINQNKKSVKEEDPSNDQPNHDAHEVLNCKFLRLQ